MNVLRSIIPETRPLLSKTVQSDTNDMLLGNPNPREVPIRKLVIEAKNVPSNNPKRIVENMPKIIEVNNKFLRLILLPVKLIVIDQKMIAP
jgi:hypothetical protein